MPARRTVAHLGLLLLLAGCDRVQENCRRIEPGMRIAQVDAIMGEPEDTHYRGHPPVGIVMVYEKGPSGAPATPEDEPVWVEMTGFPGDDPVNSVVVDTQCGAAD